MYFIGFFQTVIRNALLEKKKKRLPSKLGDTEVNKIGKAFAFIDL